MWTGVSCITREAARRSELSASTCLTYFYLRIGPCPAGATAQRTAPTAPMGTVVDGATATTPACPCTAVTVVAADAPFNCLELVVGLGDCLWLAEECVSATGRNREAAKKELHAASSVRGPPKAFNGASVHTAGRGL